MPRCSPPSRPLRSARPEDFTETTREKAQVGHEKGAVRVLYSMNGIVVRFRTEEALMRVAEFLAENHVRFEELQLPPAFSATHRAKHLHVCGRQVAKCVLLMAPTGPLLAVLPATHHIDLALLTQELNQSIHLATDEEIARVFPDCEWGVVLPFGVVYGLPTVLDDTI